MDWVVGRRDGKGGRPSGGRGRDGRSGARLSTDTRPMSDIHGGGQRLRRAEVVARWILNWDEIFAGPRWPHSYPVSFSSTETAFTGWFDDVDSLLRQRKSGHCDTTSELNYNEELEDRTHSLLSLSLEHKSIAAWNIWHLEIYYFFLVLKKIPTAIVRIVILRVFCRNVKYIFYSAAVRQCGTVSTVHYATLQLSADESEVSWTWGIWSFLSYSRPLASALPQLRTRRNVRYSPWSNYDKA